MKKLLLLIQRHGRLILRLGAVVMVGLMLMFAYFYLVRPLFFPPAVKTAAVSAKQTRVNQALFDTVTAAMTEKEKPDIQYTEVINPFVLRP